MTIPGWVDQALSLAVLSDDNQETIRTKRLVTGVLWLSLPITVLSSIQLAPNLLEGKPLADSRVVGKDLVRYLDALRDTPMIKLS